MNCCEVLHNVQTLYQKPNVGNVGLMEGNKLTLSPGYFWNIFNRKWGKGGGGHILFCHNPSPSQSKSESKVQFQSPSQESDPTSFLEDRVILDKVPDVQFSSNFHSRLK